MTGRGYSRPLLGHGHPVSWLPYEWPAGDDRQVSSQDRRSVKLRVRPPPAGTHQCQGAEDRRDLGHGSGESNESIPHARLSIVGSAAWSRIGSAAVEPAPALMPQMTRWARAVRATRSGGCGRKLRAGEIFPGVSRPTCLRGSTEIDIADL